MLKISDVGPKLVEVDVAELEARLGFTLPPRYRNFLLQYNGGTPEPDSVYVPGLGWTDVQMFFGLKQADETSCIYWNLESLSERLSEQLVPIACDSGGNVFCLSSRRQDAGAIVYFDLESVFGDLDAEAPSFTVAPNFDAFLASVRARGRQHS